MFRAMISAAAAGLRIWTIGLAATALLGVTEAQASRVVTVPPNGLGVVGNCGSCGTPWNPVPALPGESVGFLVFQIPDFIPNYGGVPGRQMLILRGVEFHFDQAQSATLEVSGIFFPGVLQAGYTITASSRYTLYIPLLENTAGVPDDGEPHHLYLRLTSAQFGAGALDQYFTFEEGTLYIPNLGVPEPSNWALMIMGFGAAGAALRRRRTFA